MGSAKVQGELWNSAPQDWGTITASFETSEVFA